MEHLKSFRSLYDDVDNQTTTFEIVTSERVFKVKWNYVDIPTEREGIFTRQYNNNLRKFCNDRYILYHWYDKGEKLCER